MNRDEPDDIYTEKARAMIHERLLANADPDVRAIAAR